MIYFASYDLKAKLAKIEMRVPVRQVTDKDDAYHVVESWTRSMYLRPGAPQLICENDRKG